MVRKSIALLLPLSVALLASCGGSSGGGGAVVVPPAKPPIVVSMNSADAPDYLCDGFEDDVEINLALRSADTSTTAGRTVLLKEGTYHVVRSIIVTSHLTLRGAGAATIIQLEDNAPSMLATAGILRLKDDSQRGLDKRVTHVTLEDFVVDGNRAHQLAATDEKKYGFYAEGDFIVLRRLVARNCAGYGFDPHSTQDTVPSLHVTIEDCEAFGNAADGFTLDMVQSSTFSRNHAHDNDRHGINLTSTTAGVTISNCRSIHNGATGLVGQNGTHDLVVQACELANNAFEGIYLRDADGCNLLGNTLRENVRSGITLRLSDRTTISGNRLEMNDPGSAARAVVLVDSATVNIVRSNTILSATARAGVLEAGTSDYNNVRDNVIDVESGPVVLIGPHSTQSGNVIP